MENPDLLITHVCVLSGVVVPPRILIHKLAIIHCPSLFFPCVTLYTLTQPETKGFIVLMRFRARNEQAMKDRLVGVSDYLSLRGQDALV